MTDKNGNPVVNLAVLQSVEDYVEKSGKFRTQCASFDIPGRNSGGASAVYIPYCDKQRFDFGDQLNEWRGHGVFRPPQKGKSWPPTDFVLFRERFHDIRCPHPCRGYRNKKIAALLKNLWSFIRADGRWVGRVATGAIVLAGLCLLAAYNTPTMWGWIVQNKQWVFSGAGITVLGALWWLASKLSPKREAAVGVTQAPPTVQANPTIAPVITNTINFPIEPRESATPKQVASPVTATPNPQPNLCVEAIKFGKICLEDDVWTFRQTFGNHIRPSRAMLADISNVPREDTHAARVAIRAAIRMDYRGRQSAYSPLPWLEEYTNLVYLDTGARKTIVLAVGEDNQTGIWKFVLNHRSDYSTRRDASAMDWTNVCPITSGLPFEILMIDVSSGALLKKFEFAWAFDAANNWPILTTVD